MRVPSPERWFLPMKGRCRVLPALPGTLYNVSFCISPLEYLQLCKWLSDVVSSAAGGEPLFLCLFRRLERVHTVTYLTKSAHAQTKVGSHFGSRRVSISGFVKAVNYTILAAFADQLLRTFDVTHFVVTPHS